MTEINQVARSMTAAVRIARTLHLPVRFIPAFTVCGSRQIIAVRKSEFAAKAQEALDLSPTRECAVVGAQGLEKAVHALYGSFSDKPFEPVAYYSAPMGFLEVMLKDCTAVTDPLVDPKGYFDLIHEGGPDGEVVGIRVHGFAGLVKSHWKLYQQLKKERQRRAEQKAQQT